MFDTLLEGMAGILAAPSDLFWEALIVVVVAAIGALLNVRGNLQMKAWLPIYRQKREKILEFITLMDHIGLTVHSAGELIEGQKEPVVQQFVQVQHYIRHTKDRALSNVTLEILSSAEQVLPTDQDVMEIPYTSLDKINVSRLIVMRALSQEVHEAMHRASALQRPLLFIVNDPDLIGRAASYAAEIYGITHSEKGWGAIDHDDFAERWSQLMSPIKIGLRKDITRSGRSLRKATRLSLMWQFRHLPGIRHMRRKMRKHRREKKHFSRN